MQVTQFKLVEMLTRITADRELVHSCIRKRIRGEDATLEISMAKLVVGRTSRYVADECIQIHGGWGYMKEYEVERHYRDVRLNRIGAGTDEIMLEVIGRSYGL